MIEAGAGWGEAGLRGAGKGVRHSTTQPVGPGGHETKCLETGTIRLILPESKAVERVSSFPASLSPLFWSRFFVPFPSFFLFRWHFSSLDTFVFSEQPGGVLSQREIFLGPTTPLPTF